MIEIHWGDEQTNTALMQWVSHQLWDNPHLLDKGRAMTVLIDGELSAVMVFHNWNPKAGVIEITGAAVNKRWLNPKSMREMARYAFDQIGAQVVVMKTSTTDRSLLRMLKACGFKPYVIPRLRGRNEDEIIHTLTVEDWQNSKFERRYVKP